MNSFHCFVFPFKWDIIEKPCLKIEEIDFGTRVNLCKFQHEIEKSGWKRKNDFVLSDPSAMAYNEYLYYHDFVRKVIFDRRKGQNDLCGKKNIKPDEVMRHYEYPLGADAYYEIDVSQFNGKKYKLKLTGLHLHIYKTGVGVLAFDLENYETSLKDDILAINEYGRRIYPQFLSKNFDLTFVKKAFLADSITVSYDGKNKLIEDFSEYKKENFLNKEISTSNPFLPPKFLKEIFSHANFGYQNISAKPMNSSSRINLFIEHITDDRMFTICWFGNNYLVNNLSCSSKGTFIFENSDWWYCYLFGDKKWPSVANNKLKKKDIEKHTYDRWAEYGTLFGLTRDTFVCVSSDIPTLEMVGSPPIASHMQTIYYQMVILGLVQRASILKFSAEVSNLTDISSQNSLDELPKKVEQLYGSYIEFINKIYFREVTSQIQGIEIYDMLQNVMNIEKDVTNLDNEITELHSYVSLINDKKRNDQSYWLNVMAIVFLPASLVIAFLGIGFIGTDSKIIWFSLPKQDVCYALIIVSMVLAVSLFIAFYKKVKTKFKKLKHFFN